MTFYSMKDVWDELVRLYDKMHRNKNIENLGESLYLTAGYFVNHSLLLDQDIQNTIKMYLYSKISNTPPYRTVQETPFTLIEDFLIIDQEIKEIGNSKQSASRSNIKSKIKRKK